MKKRGTNGGIAMTRTIRARVTRGNLVLLEPLDLPDGSEVDVIVATVPSADDIAASRATAGGWKGKIDAEALIRDVYGDRLLQTRPAPRV